MAGDSRWGRRWQCEKCGQSGIAFDGCGLGECGAIPQSRVRTAGPNRPMAGDAPTTTTGTAYPLRTLTDAQLTALIRAARVANTPHSPTEVEEPPRDAQPARLSGHP